jgi:hypothetical protein
MLGGMRSSTVSDFMKVGLRLKGENKGGEARHWNSIFGVFQGASVAHSSLRCGGKP